MIDKLIDTKEDNEGRTLFNPSPEVFPRYNRKEVELFMKRGKAVVPIYKNNPYYGATGRKGELRQDDPVRFQKAMTKEPIIARAVQFNANMVVGYGFSFGSKQKSWSESKTIQNDLNEKIENWREYINLDDYLLKSELCAQIYGDAYAEKIPDGEGNLLDDNGWGISDLKVLHPLTIFEERKLDGQTEAYYQIPHKLLGSDFHTLTNEEIINEGIKILPENMVHIKYGDYTNGTYGKSIMSSILETINMKIGMKQDASMMVQRRAIPTVVWRVGFDDEIPPPNLVNKVKNNLQAALGAYGDYDLFVSSLVKPQIVAAGEKALDIVPYLNYLNSELIKGLGIPEIFLGEGDVSSQAAAQAQIEVYSRTMMTRQKYLGHIVRRWILPDLIYPPERNVRGTNRDGSANSGAMDKRQYDIFNLRPKQWRNIPRIIWKPLEDVANMRLRIGELINDGLITDEEARLEMGYEGDLNLERLNPANKLTLAQVELTKKQTEFVGKETSNSNSDKKKEE